LKKRIGRTLSFWRVYGTVALARLLFRKLFGILRGQSLFNPLDSQLDPIVEAAIVHQDLAQRMLSPSHVVAAQFPALQPLTTYLVATAGRRRVSVVTDSISKGSLFGGVGTALLFAAQLALRKNAVLRIITRYESALARDIAELLSVYGVKMQEEIQFSFAALGSNSNEIDIYEDEIFVTTSWWSTTATSSSVSSKRIIYLLQEDERMFYAYGDERLKCEQALSRTDIRYLINTKLLFDHFALTSLPNIAQHGMWFEPAFPASLFYPRARSSKRRFFFYARPGNERNLFYFGIQVIEAALAANILDPNVWEIYLVGNKLPPLVFGNGILPIKYENLSWSDYADLAGTIDLALSLMYTPHPSYPPLDMAASGAVVVTNRLMNKTSLSAYSDNILCADLNIDSLLAAIQSGVALSASPIRQKNFESAGLQRSWEKAFAPILNELEAM